jgi:phage terminase large subunit
MREMQALEEQKRVCNVPVDPMLKVHTVWDLGWNDSTAIIFVQRHLSELRVVDYLEDSHRTLAEYAAELRRRDYSYGTHWLPWDGAGRQVPVDRCEHEP